MTAEEIQVPTGLTTVGLLGRRYVARIIDTVVISALVMIVLGLVNAVAAAVSGRPLWTPINLLLLGIVWISYGTLLESSKLQATLGKRWLGLRVYDSQAGRITLPQSAGRNLLKDGPFLLLSIIPGASLLSVLWLAAHVFVVHQSPVDQAIHDRAAHTWVGAPESTIQLHLT